MDQPNNDPQLLFVPPGSLENLIGTHFYKKKGHSDKDRETQYAIDDCNIEEFRHTYKYLGLFFGAFNCPPSQTFLNILKEFYSEVNIDAKQCEILYVPCDKAEDEYRAFYTSMAWMTIPYHDQARIKSLKAKYRITGIPTLVIVKMEDGNLVTVRGRKDIHDQGTKCIADWNKTVELNKEREQNRLKEEAELEQLRLKLTQICLEKFMATQNTTKLQHDDSQVVIGVNLNA